MLVIRKETMLTPAVYLEIKKQEKKEGIELSKDFKNKVNKYDRLIPYVLPMILTEDMEAVIQNPQWNGAGKQETLKLYKSMVWAFFSLLNLYEICAELYKNKGAAEAAPMHNINNADGRHGHACHGHRGHVCRGHACHGRHGHNDMVGKAGRCELSGHSH